jgi:hypothetical protein
LVPARKANTENLFIDVCRCFQEVYAATLDRNALWTAGNRYFESLDGSYDRALFPFPDYPSESLVNYEHRGHDYYFYLEKGIALSKALFRIAIDYYNGGESEKNRLKKYLKDWNLDMGYWLNVSAEAKGGHIESVRIRFEHSWCHNYGLYDLQA